jgi:hypothetical protein
MKELCRQVVFLMFLVVNSVALLAQCGSTELARMNSLATAFQKDVTMFDSLGREQLGSLRHMAHDCTSAITTNAQRAGMKDMTEMSKNDLILLYWISVMDDTASTVEGLLDMQKHQQSDTSEQTEIPGAGPCTNIPVRYDQLEQRLAWFYGCMHESPPSIAAIKAKVAALPPEKRKALEQQSFAAQEALLGVANADLPIQVFPK